MPSKDDEALPIGAGGRAPGEDPASGRDRVITDLALAAFLSVAGHRLKAIRRENGRGIFVFEDGPALGRDTLAFYNRSARVDPLTYAETLRNLKAAAQVV